MKKWFKIYSPKIFLERIQIILVLFSILYGICFLFSREIEAFLSFPGIFKKTELYTNAWLDPEVIQIVDKKWNTIQGIYIDRKAKKTIYYFHGGKKSLPGFYDDISVIANLGYNVIAFDYQGYGASQWFPYQEDISSAAESFYRFIKVRKDFREEDTIIWGCDIGASVAIEFAKHHKNIDRMVLMSVPSSQYDMFKSLLGIPMQEFLGKENSLISFESVQEFEFPIFMIHWKDDKIIPIWQGQKVFDNYKWEKYFLSLNNTKRDNILTMHADILRSPLRVFLSMNQD